MIILDTNILRGFKLDSVSSDLLKTIRTAGVESVCVPWVALEELTSHRAVRYREKYEAAAKAMKSFKQATPWLVIPDRIEQLELERFQQHWREQYLAVVDEIPTSETALRDATFREMNVLPPCKAIAVGEHETVKTGGRDAAIWLTAVEYARDHPKEKVYFVSKNTKDFGDGTVYSPPMDEDLAGIRDRFVHLTSLDEVVKLFTVPAEVREEQVAGILSGAESLKAISSEAIRYMPPDVWSRRRFDGAMVFLAEDLGTGEFETVTTEPVQMVGWAEAPTVAIDGIGELSAYRIGDHVWCSATVRWILSGPAVLGDTHRVEVVGCAWETRVLTSTTNTDSRLTILRSQATRALSTSEFAAFAPSATSLARRTEKARQRGLPLGLMGLPPETAGQETLARLERALHVPWFVAPPGAHHRWIQFAEPQADDDSPWFAAPREGDDGGIQFAEPREDDDNPWLSEPQEGEDQE
ncbi:PIN domain-containing protein [Streptomyces sp. gb14]|uniref:PIN domain-containing protein n=1 Tax=Streptomyces sp. gb14 TaxID=1827753 RepID=UPI000BF1761C|nr:PIN domain-containing protein [Streptomyces sp. gb14]